MYYKSHVEKQVMTYFSRAHAPLQDEDEKDPEIKMLETLQPSNRLREAWIAVDHQPCNDCLTY
jgi:hypothetical protein